MNELIEKVKDFSQGIWGKMERLWKRLDSEAKDHIVDVIKYVDAVKNAVRDGSIAGELIESGVNLTPTKIDNVLLSILRGSTVEILAKLTLCQDIINETNKGEKLKKIVSFVSTFDKVQNDMYWSAVYSYLYEIASDGKITGLEIAGFAKFAYNKYKNSKK